MKGRSCKSTSARIFLLMLCSVIFVSSFTGCKKEEQGTQASDKGSTNTETISFPLKNPITLKYWVGFTSTVLQNYGESELYKELEKRTGIHINFIHPAEGQGKEQFNLMIAARDLPDIIEGGFTEYAGGRQKGFDDGIIIDLKELVQKYAPDLNKIYQTYLDILMDVETVDGKWLHTPFMRGDKFLVTYTGPIMRKDWLDDLGIKPPTTLDEWYTTLKAFKEKKGATAPLTGNTSLISSQWFMSPYGIGREYYIDNGKVKYGPVEPKYKEYLTMFAKWYKEGLIDSEFPTNAAKNYDAKMTNGQSGAIIGNTGGAVGKYLGLMKSKDPKYDLMGVQYPSLKQGEPVLWMQKDGPIATTGAQITSACKNVKEAIAWLNYGYSKEGTLLYNFGVEGVSYKMENGYPKYTDAVMKNPLGPMSVVGVKYMRSVNNGPFVQDKRYMEQYLEYPQQSEAIKNWTVWSKEVAEANNTFRGTLSTDEIAQTATKQTEITTYKDEMFLKFVMGQESLDNFDKYIAQMKKLGIDDVLKVRQGAYDRFLKKFPQATKSRDYRILDIYGF